MIAHARDLLAAPLQEIGTRDGASPGTIESVAKLFTDGTVVIGIWECTPGTFPTAKVGTNEAMHILSGSATLRDAEGNETEVRAGDSVVTPDGWRGTWTVHEVTRKLYTTWPSSGA